MNRKLRPSYDFGWTFRHDWLRDGRPWFILDARQTEARTQQYNQDKLRYVRKLLRGVSKTAYLQDILDHVLAGGLTDQDRIEAIVRFVQEATWHNPLESPFEADAKTIVTAAHELLELHDARCWHTAEILRQLFLQAGWPARITFLPSPQSASVQVVTEVQHDGAWRLTDANYFKQGVILRQPDGALPTLAWLRQQPHYADRFPGGWIFPPEYLVNAAGLPVTGQFHLPFPEAEDTWGADSYYCYYLGAPERFPPIRPPRLGAAKLGPGRVLVSWQPSRSHTSRFMRYDLTLRRCRDQHLVYAARDLEETRAPLNDLDPLETYEVAVRATDEHLLVEPETWYPASTLTLSLGDL